MDRALINTREDSAVSESDEARRLTELGIFLRQRRENLDPARLGLPRGGRRRYVDGGHHFDRFAAEKPPNASPAEAAGMENDRVPAQVAFDLGHGILHVAGGKNFNLQLDLHHPQGLDFNLGIEFGVGQNDQVGRHPFGDFAEIQAGGRAGEHDRRIA